METFVEGRSSDKLLAALESNLSTVCLWTWNWLDSAINTKRRMVSYRYSGCAMGCRVQLEKIYLGIIIL